VLNKEEVVQNVQVIGRRKNRNKHIKAGTRAHHNNFEFVLRQTTTTTHLSLLLAF
jgi:hypothetical protein